MAVNGCSLYPQGGKVETVGGVIDTPTGTVSLRVGIALIQVLSPSLNPAFPFLWEFGGRGGGI
ncbi:hypothetical protein [uncultured Bacteroides sp.]|uniref:hypothetical protein n=1 Tax=uncultured Bacteroides sp. TaxID=162156 RepID=UPI00259A8D5B|nr:hypothetical protein [uncultured Bacteroides sp.]